MKTPFMPPVNDGLVNAMPKYAAKAASVQRCAPATDRLAAERCPIPPGA